MITPATRALLELGDRPGIGTGGLRRVIEEKMQRIAEVLLGSVRPFELMLGKLLGMVAVSITLSAVYLGGA